MAISPQDTTSPSSSKTWLIKLRKVLKGLRRAGLVAAKEHEGVRVAARDGIGDGTGVQTPPTSDTHGRRQSGADRLRHESNQAVDIGRYDRAADDMNNQEALPGSGEGCGAGRPRPTSRPGDSGESAGRSPLRHRSRLQSLHARQWIDRGGGGQSSSIRDPGECGDAGSRYGVQRTTGATTYRLPRRNGAS
jgi:hypothetical protein